MKQERDMATRLAKTRKASRPTPGGRDRMRGARRRTAGAYLLVAGNDRVLAEVEKVAGSTA